MRRGYILLYTIITIVAISILSVAILTNTAAYIRDNSLELQKNSAYISSQKILQLCLAYLKPYFSGIKGIMLGWTSSNVSQNVEWWDRFKKLMLSQTDGKYWENFFTRINEQKYYDPSVISQFKQDLVDFTLSGSVVVLPITGSYQVNQNPYSALVVSKANSGKLEAYSVAVVAVDFLNKYAYFTEIEKRPGGDTIYFISREIIDGPMRSNDIIHVSGNPRFKSSVEVKGVDIQSGRPIYDDPFSPKILTEQDIQAYRMSMIASNYSSDLNVLVKSVPDFLSSSGETGINLNLSRITRGQKSLTPTALIVEFKSAQGQGNDHFMKVYVEYDGPGSSGRDPLFTIKPRTSGNGYQIVIHGQNAEEWLGLSITGRERTVDVNFNGVLKSNLTVKLKNHSNNDKPMYVDGQYTVYSEKNVEIYDHIIYEDFRSLFPHNTVDNIVVNEQMVEQMRATIRSDFLNIVANDSVIIKEKQRNLKINASIYAFNESFTVEDYDEGNPSGQLTIFGSLMQNYRGPVGTFRGNDTVTGYYKNYIYDDKILEGISSIGTPAKRGNMLILTLRGVY